MSILLNKIEKYQNDASWYHKKKEIGRKPWITSALLESISHRNKLWQQYLQNPSNDKLIHYKKYRNTLTSLILKTKNEYYRRKIVENKEDKARMWNAVQDCISKKCSKIIPTKIIHEENTIFNKKQIATTFNKVFANVGKKLASKLQTNSVQFKLQNTVKQSMYLTPVLPNEIRAIILK